MQNRRRRFLRQATLGFFSVLTLGGFFKPVIGFAFSRKQHFIDGSLEHTLKELFADRKILKSKRITLRTPKTAENGASVPITIKSDLDHINKVYLLVEKNPVPLAAVFTLSPDVEVYIKARIKMAETCNVIAVAESGDKLFRTARSVNVTVGGCGGR